MPQSDQMIGCKGACSTGHNTLAKASSRKPHPGFINAWYILGFAHNYAAQTIGVHSPATPKHAGTTATAIIEMHADTNARCTHARTNAQSHTTPHQAHSAIAPNPTHAAESNKHRCLAAATQTTVLAQHLRHLATCTRQYSCTADTQAYCGIDASLSGTQPCQGAEASLKGKESAACAKGFQPHAAHDYVQGSAGC